MIHSTDFDYPFTEEEWGAKKLWPPETVARLVSRAIEEFRAGRFERNFEDKLIERKITLQTVLNIIGSRKTFIIKYRDAFARMMRIGFWHPQIQIFVAWKPGHNSQFKTAFKKRRGIEYMQGLPEAVLIYRQKRGRER